MNQNTVKQLRNIADKLPPIFHRKKVVKQVLGRDLSPDLLLKITGKLIPTRMYNFHSSEICRVDHYDRMKDILKLQGRPGVEKYVIHVKKTAPYNQEMMAVQPTIPKPQHLKISFLTRIINFIKKLFNARKHKQLA